MTSPSQTTAGAAHARAKAALGDAIDKRLNLDLEVAEFAILAQAIGCKPSQVRARLDAATLGELEAWREKVNKK